MRRLISTILFTFILLAAHVCAGAQPANLLRNPDAVEGVKHWRVYGDAKAEEAGGERTFVLRDKGYLLQDVTLAGDLTGQYAVFTAQAVCESCAAGGLGGPSLYGYMMNPGSTHEGGRVNAYLQDQEMSYPPGAAGWRRLWGVFRIPVGTGQIRFFLRHGDGVARFRGLGLYVFPTPHEAHSFAAGQTVPLTAEAAPVSPAECAGASLRSLTLGGVRLGMSAAEVSEVFSGIASDANAQRALERAQSASGHGDAHLFISPQPYHHDPNFPLAKSYWIKFLDARVYAVQASYEGASWDSADEFVRGAQAAHALPPPERWELINGNASRYLICEDVELRFYAAPRRGRNNDYVLLVDHAAEKLLAERKTKSAEPRPASSGARRVTPP